MKRFLFSNAVLFVTPCLIWGSTWYVITFQLGVVDPIVSVCYRFAVAGLLMLSLCLFGRMNLRFSPRDSCLRAWT